MVVVLPEPCRPTIRITTGGVRGEVDRLARPRRARATSSSWTILTTIWPGVTERTTSWPTAFAFTRVDEVAHDVERDVGLEQRAAHFAHGLADVGLAQRAAARELVEDGAEGARIVSRTSIRLSVSHTKNALTIGQQAESANEKRTRGRNALAGVDPLTPLICATALRAT